MREEGGAVASSPCESRMEIGRSQILRLPRMGVVFCFPVALAAMLMPGSSGAAQNLRALEGRVVQGRVAGANKQPVENAIVYLQDEKSLEIKTYITAGDGKFHFVQLSPDADYQVWARYQGHRSKTKSISSFNSKTQFNFDLKINGAK